MELIDTMISFEWPGQSVVRLCEAGICMDKAKELQLVEEARGCSREAFNQLVECYKKPLTKGFISGWPGMQRADAEDIAQEVWVRLWECIHRSSEEGGYDPTKGGFYTWVINYIALPKIKDWQRGKAGSREAIGIPEYDNGETKIEAAVGSKCLKPFEVLVGKEDLRRRLMAYCEFFRLTFLCGGYPHEQLAFGFAKLVHSRHKSDRTVEGVPKDVDSEYGELRLKVLIDKFQDRYRATSKIDDAEVFQFLKTSLEPVRKRLGLIVKELIRPLPDHLKRIQKNAVAGTCLRDYYVKKSKEKKDYSTEPISYWCDRVKKKVRRVSCLPEQASEEEIIEEVALRLRKGPIEPRGCTRCKLRHVPPCVNRKSQEKVLVQ